MESLEHTLRPGWYLPAPTTLPPAALEIFEKYTDLSAADILPHLIAIRDRAWKVFPYPCIGSFRFLDFSVSTSTDYSALLARLQAGATLLDLGCCFGQDLRRLVCDGAPSENLFGADIHPEFIDLGYDLFRDRDTLRAVFLAPADVFDDADDAPLALMPRVDVVHIGSFLHLFNYTNQVRAMCKIVKLLKPGKGSVVMGRQAGSVDSGEYPHPTNPQRTLFRHNCASFQRLWDEVGGEWEVKVGLLDPKKGATEGDGSEARFFKTGARWLQFSVTRG